MSEKEHASKIGRYDASKDGREQHYAMVAYRIVVPEDISLGLAICKKVYIASTLCSPKLR